MGYMHIDNLYKNIDILLFKECYALEKIHGTSAHISWNKNQLHLNPGGEKMERFEKLFNREELTKTFTELGHEHIVIFGEAYGGKQQGMSGTYGKELKFAAFDVKIGEHWLNVSNAEDVAKKLGLEFVHYDKIPTDMDLIDAQRDATSVQAERNGIGGFKMREGVVLRPVIEVTKNNGDRIIVKHKGNEFRETKTKREVDPAKLKVLEDAKEIANEWVTPMRLTHVLDKIGNPDSMESASIVIKAMIEDVYREGKGEIVESREVNMAIGRVTAKLFKERVSLI